MANSILTPSVIAREALMVLMNNMVMGNLVNRTAITEFSAAVGDTVTVRKPATFIAADMPIASNQDIKEIGIPVVMSKWRGVRFSLTAKEASMSLRDYSSRYITPGVQAIAQDVDSFLCGLLVGFPYKRVQTATTVKIDDIAGLSADMSVRKVPLTDRYLVLDPLSAAKYKVLGPVLDAGQRGNQNAINDAQLGRLMGFDTYEDQNIKTEGTMVGTLAGCSTPATVALGAESMTVTDTDATPGLLPAGTTFTIAGDTQIYVLTDDATQTATGCLIKFAPPLQVAITSAKAISAGTVASSGKTESAAFHKNAIDLVTCPLAKPLGTPSEVISDNGMSIRVVYTFDQTTWSDIIALDVLYGGRVMDAELGERLIGQ